ncbi:hypothetical protein CBM2609_A10045 [Cupriavidus taiwanensis]|nr:hypothetical protein CBM2609_A10045 [Cupriavidus taiwanensis]
MLRCEHGLKISHSPRQQKYRCDEWRVASRETTGLPMNGVHGSPATRRYGRVRVAAAAPARARASVPGGCSERVLAAGFGLERDLDDADLLLAAIRQAVADGLAGARPQQRLAHRRQHREPAGVEVGGVGIHQGPVARRVLARQRAHHARVHGDHVGRDFFGRDDGGARQQAVEHVLELGRAGAAGDALQAGDVEFGQVQGGGLGGLGGLGFGGRHGGSSGSRGWARPACRAGGGGQVLRVGVPRSGARINGSAKALRRSPATTETLARARFGPGPAMGDESGWEPGGIRRCADPAGRHRALGALGQAGGQGERGRVRAAGPQRADRRIGHRRQAIGHGFTEKDKRQRLACCNGEPRSGGSPAALPRFVHRAGAKPEQPS